MVDDDELDNMMIAPKQDDGTIELTEEQLEQLVQQSKMVSQAKQFKILVV